MNILKVFLKERNPEREKILEVLKSIPIFAELNWLELRKVEAVIHARKYKKEEAIFYEDEPGVSMYIIKEGAVKLVKGEKNKEKEIAKFKKGDFFGEIALLTNTPRSATAAAIEETEILALSRPDLMSIIDSHPKTGAKILLKVSQIIGERLVKTVKEEVEKHA